MSMTVVMQFRGDVICYQKKGSWRFIFPTDDHHVVKFTDDARKKDNLRIGGKHRRILVKPYSPLYPTPNPNDTFGSLLNMSAWYMHGTSVVNGKTVSNLSEKKNPQPIPPVGSESGRELMFFDVPAGRPGISSMTESDYWVDVDTVKGGEIKLGRPVAAEITLEIDLKHNVGFDLIMEDTGKPIVEIRYQEGVTAFLRFDNHCEGPCKSADDFVHYYDWLEDVKVPGKRMYAGKEPRESYVKFKPISSTVGNCDPVGSDPPPQPE